MTGCGVSWRRVVFIPWIVAKFMPPLIGGISRGSTWSLIRRSFVNSSYHRGNVLITEPYSNREFDSFLCCHCNSIIIVQPSGSENVWSPSTTIAFIGQPRKQTKPRSRQRGFCFRCMAPTCGKRKCVRCVPFEAKLEVAEGSRRFWKQLDLVRG